MELQAKVWVSVKFPLLFPRCPFDAAHPACTLCFLDPFVYCAHLAQLCDLRSPVSHSFNYTNILVLQLENEQKKDPLGQVDKGQTK